MRAASCTDPNKYTRAKDICVPMPTAPYPARPCRKISFRPQLLHVKRQCTAGSAPDSAFRQTGLLPRLASSQRRLPIISSPRLGQATRLLPTRSFLSPAASAFAFQTKNRQEPYFPVRQRTGRTPKCFPSPLLVSLFLVSGSVS